MLARRANAVDAEAGRGASTRRGRPRSAAATTRRKRPVASSLWGLQRGHGAASTSTLHCWPPEPRFYCGKRPVCGTLWWPATGDQYSPPGPARPSPSPPLCNDVAEVPSRSTLLFAVSQSLVSPQVPPGRGTNADRACRLSSHDRSASDKHPAVTLPFP